MRISNITSVLLFLLLLNFFPEQLISQGKKGNIVTIAFYNVENLFDTIDDPATDDQEFTPAVLPDGIH